eukprot:392558_1
MKLENNKNDVFIWHIHGTLWERFKSQSILSQPTFYSPHFKTAVGTECNIRFVINQSNQSANMRPYLNFECNMTSEKQTAATFGVQCTIEEQETGLVVDVLGVGDHINQFHNGQSAGSNTFNIKKLQNLPQLKMKLQLKFLQNTQINWRISGNLL